MGQVRAKEKQQEGQIERIQQKGEYIEKHSGERGTEEAWKAGKRREG